MGRVVPFRRPARRRRSRPARRGASWRQAWFETRPIILAIVLATLGFVHQSAGFFEPPKWVRSEPVTVRATFTRCDMIYALYCVTDGDTFRIGGQRFRVTGIDTAEKDARCPAEAARAEVSTNALHGWLNRGPFEIATRLDEPSDRYGRTLAIVTRARADGTAESLADYMRSEGGARWYSGGWRDDWCP